MNTNLLGVAFLIITSNYATVNFQPVPCDFCARQHHYRAIETWMVNDSYAVNVMDGTNVVTHVLKSLGNYRSITTTNYISSPTNYLAPGVKPFMPPVPAEFMPRRSNTNITVLPFFTSPPTK